MENIDELGATLGTQFCKKTPLTAGIAKIHTYNQSEMCCSLISDKICLEEDLYRPDNMESSIYNTKYKQLFITNTRLHLLHHNLDDLKSK